jgi:predicted transcriptional regulator of viral defense system
VVAEWKLFGTTNVWRRGMKVSMSDPSRTIVDILANPSLGAGITHVAEILQAYWESESRNESKLLEYIDRLRAGSTAKRLGYLVETLNLHAPRLIRECLSRRTEGVILLDPSMHPDGPIVSRWGLRANVKSLLAKGLMPT